MSELYDLAIVGAGLSALSALQAGIASARTVVLDYQEHPGGFLKAALPAPGFEEAWELVQSSRIPQRVTTFYGTTAVGLLPAFEAGEPHVLIVRQRQGTEEVHAQRVLIACGGLELTREHAQIPGTRPAGVITPVLAHQLLSRGYLPGKRAVVYGDSRYARATAERLAGVGIEVTLVLPPKVEETRAAGQPEGKQPSLTGAELIAIEGFPRLEKVKFRRDGEFFDVPADTLVYGTGMMANTHWLKGSGIITGEYGTIQVNSFYQTNVQGVYAVGTVIAPSLDHAGSIAMGKEVASLLVGGTQ
jgi:thioredoxin reductase